MNELTNSTLGRRIALCALAVAFVICATALIAYNALVPTNSSVVLAAGQVAPNDIIAPHSITYESEVLTKLARQAAWDGIREVFDPPNPSVARQQLQLARHILDYIDNVRHDSYATPSQQTTDIVSIATLKLKPDLAGKLLTLADDAWKDVDAQVMSVLERTMRDAIRDDNLTAIYGNLPNLVSVTMDDTRTSMITALVKELIKPNSFYNEERTQEARTQAAQSVTVERRSFAQGQIVVRAGTIVTDADMEALTQLKLLQPADRRVQAVGGAMMAVILFGTLGTLYLRQLHADLFRNVPQMVLIGTLFLAFLAGARIFGSSGDFQSHVYPAAAFSLIIVTMTGPQPAIIITGALAAMIALLSSSSLEVGVMVAAGGVAGVLTLNRTDRINAYLRAGLVIGLVNIAVGLLFVLSQGSSDPIKVITIIGAGMVNGILGAGVAIAGLYLVSGVLNMPTSLKLIELSQPSQPLLQRLLREAPGTYQHSLQVANLAELAAERIGANPAMVRVGALYHDIGKMIYPHFFVENQVEGINPHDTLDDPLRSAQIIISHVTEGERLAHKYRLPAVFIDLIMQHHGTTQVLYFYNKACKAVDCDPTRIAKSDYSYPGPRPQTREAAILMLADSCESIVRAKRPQTRQEIEEIVNDIIETRLKDTQLDESSLTVNDLKVLREVFVTTLQGVFHPRIVYPPLPTPPVVPAQVAAPEPNDTRVVSVPASITPRGPQESLS